MTYDKLAHDAFIKEHKKIFKMLDALIILGVLFNFGAAALTNALVTREQPIETIEFREVNPVAAKVSGYALHEDSTKIISGFVFMLIGWAFITFVYLWHRLTVKDVWGLTRLSTLTLVWFVMLGWDFFNNFGNWIGIIMR